ncbi:MAG TPA: PhoPQ-activated protein PqaA family protein [Armatimonadota bacterium]|nr:PhoPQ-activated protein PqaA family protein [Armatimonadota bacterium]
MNMYLTGCVGMMVLFCAVEQPAMADIGAYVRKPDPAFQWEQRGVQEIDGVRVYDLHLTSLVWQGITWEHRLQIFQPIHPDRPHFCSLYNTGGGGSAENTAMGVKMAKMTGAPFAILFNIPNQPLFDGLTEDRLVVYTWLRFLETGDESWPLHFPMTMAVIKAMEAIQAHAEKAELPSVDGFLICGASKRGWTTWLAGATRDPRIKAIAPMVIDTLNVPAQTSHQLKVLGTYSEQVKDYIDAGIPDKLKTPAGRRLMELEDPYNYRSILTLPKLIILGTNDRYWAQDALNIYWDGLKGPKWVLYDPNSGHGLEDRARVFNTLSAFIRAVADGKHWPTMRWTWTGATLRLTSNPPPISARLFHTTAPTQDFRDSHWTSDPATIADSGFTASAPIPAHGFGAAFGEATYNLDGHSFTLSTQIRILGGNENKTKDGGR